VNVILDQVSVRTMRRGRQRRAAPPGVPKFEIGPVRASVRMLLLVLRNSASGTDVPVSARRGLLAADWITVGFDEMRTRSVRTLFVAGLLSPRVIACRIQSPFSCSRILSSGRWSLPVATNVFRGFEQEPWCLRAHRFSNSRKMEESLFRGLRFTNTRAQRRVWIHSNY
jgi:hypothetical protein